MGLDMSFITNTHNLKAGVFSSCSISLSAGTIGCFQWINFDPRTPLLTQRLWSVLPLMLPSSVVASRLNPPLTPQHMSMYSSAALEMTCAKIFEQYQFNHQ